MVTLDLSLLNDWKLLQYTDSVKLQDTSQL